MTIARYFGAGGKETVLKFIIDLKPVTKKNSQRIVMCGKYPRILPSKAYEKYEKDCKAFMPHMNEPIDYPVNVKAIYYMPTRRRVDLTNLHEALHDIMVHYHVLADDNSNIVVSTDGSRVLVDKWHPHTEIEITRAGEQIANT